MTTAVTLASMGNGPAFSAYPSSGQTITTATATKILFQTVLYDTNNNYSSVNSRFTPTVTGYYHVITAIRMPLGTSRMILAIRKNGTVVKSLQDIGGGLYALSGSAMIYMNGTTDYLEIYVEYSANTGSLANTAPDSYFEAAMIRGA